MQMDFVGAVKDILVFVFLRSRVNALTRKRANPLNIVICGIAPQHILCYNNFQFGGNCMREELRKKLSNAQERYQQLRGYL